MKRYQVTVALYRGATQTTEVSAENANEAVITALLQVRYIIIDALG
jgi:hypothetical protein